MRVKLRTGWLAAALVVGGINPSGVPVHAGTGVTFNDSSAVPQVGLEDSSVTGAYNGLPGCGDVVDPVTTQNNRTVNWATQEPNRGTAPGEYADVSSVSVTPDVFSSRAPVGAVASSTSPTGFTYDTSKYPDSSFNSGNTAIPGLRITLHLCGSIPRDNFTTPAANGGVSYTGMDYTLFFQTPEQESKLPIGYGSGGNLNHEGPYPASSGWYYFSTFSLTTGTATVQWGVFDPAGNLVYTTGEPDLLDGSADCSTSTSGANKCLNEGGNFPDGLGDKIAAAIDDDPGGACTRCVLSWFMPYQAVSTGTPFTSIPILQPGDTISNIQLQAFASAVVPTPGQLQTGPLAGVAPNSLGGFLFTADWAPGNQYCSRLSGSPAPDPTKCYSTSDNAYDQGVVGVTGNNAEPNPLQNAAAVEQWSTNRCQQYDTDIPTSGTYPYGPYPGETGQQAGDLFGTPACSGPTAGEASHFPGAGTYTEGFNSLPSAVIAIPDPLSIYGRILVPEAPHNLATGITAVA
ncbi:MAG: hypothetical protein ACYDAY_05965 [Candidatus Dormibacteria bacterium]